MIQTKKKKTFVMHTYIVRNMCKNTNSCTYVKNTQVYEKAKEKNKCRFINMHIHVIFKNIFPIFLSHSPYYW